MNRLKGFGFLFAQGIVILGLTGMFQIQSADAATCPSCDFYQAKGACGSQPQPPYDSTCWNYCANTVFAVPNIGQPCTAIPGPPDDPVNPPLGPAPAGVPDFSDLALAPGDPRCAFPEAVQVNITVQQAQLPGGGNVPFGPGQDLNFSIAPVTKTVIVPVKALSGRAPGP